jgi:hypothetical protein
MEPAVDSECSGQFDGGIPEFSIAHDVQLRLRLVVEQFRERAEERGVVFNRAHSADCAYPQAGAVSTGRRRVTQKWRYFDAIGNHSSQGRKSTSLFPKTLRGFISDEYHSICDSGHRSEQFHQPRLRKSGQTVLSVDNDLSAYKPPRNSGIVVDDGVVAVNDIDSVSSHLFRHSEDHARAQALRFVKSPDWNAERSGAPGHCAGVSDRVNEGAMARLLLGKGKIYSHFLEATDIEIQNNLGNVQDKGAPAGCSLSVLETV